MTVPFKTLWVIGASSGIGRDVARAFARLGVRVAVSARRVDPLESLVDENGGMITAYPLDVTQGEAVHQVAARIRADLGEIDAVLFCAASWTNTPNNQPHVADIGPTLETNVLGAVRVIESVLPRMQERRFGRIVLVSSVAGFRGLPRGVAYGMSKAALTHLAEGLVFEARPHGVVVQVVHPGFVKTPLTDMNDFPMPFIIPSERAAARIVQGMMGEAFEITFPRRFTYMLKILRLLPYRLYFALVQKATGSMLR